MNDKSLLAITQQNQRAWNEIARVRSRVFPPAEFFAKGGSTLVKTSIDAVQQNFDTMVGLRLIHLQCATGEDTLSWANLGLDAIGIDISDEQITIARQKAVAAGLPVRFQAANVYELPAVLPDSWFNLGFDVVFTGGGAIVWLPDLPRWAIAIATLLKPGGVFILHEEHPVRSCLWIENEQIQIVDDYFRRARPIKDNGWFHFKGGEEAQEIKYEFTWPIGDVVTAIAQAGLIIDRLEEFPGGPEWRLEQDKGQLGHLPGQYLLVAHKQNI